MPRLKESCKQDLKLRINIVDVVSRVATPRRAGGSRFKALCPFHQEKTPSFHFDADKGFYKCFGCGKSGDIFTFVQETEGLTFGEAIETLAQRFNVALEYEEGGGGPSREERSLRQELFDLHEFAADHLHQAFKGTGDAAEWMRRYWTTERRFPAELADEFKIGLSDATGSGLGAAILRKKFSETAIRQCGLFYLYEDALLTLNALKPRFRGRLIIPIRDHQGRVVAFTARQTALTPEDDKSREAKYVNSPETPIFTKGNLLFNLDRARAHAGEGKPFVMVEGQLDALRCWSAGLKTAIAPQGTAITESQLVLLRRYHSELECFLDTDEAGKNAAIKLVTLGLQAGIEVRFLTSSGKGKLDPDLLLLQEGAAGYERLRKDRLHGIAFTARMLFPDPGAMSPNELQAAAKRLLEIVNEADSQVLRMNLLELCAEVLGFRGSEAFNALAQDSRVYDSVGGIAPVPVGGRSGPGVATIPPPPDESSAPERDLLLLVLHCTDLGKTIAAACPHEWIDARLLSGTLLNRFLGEFSEDLWPGNDQLDPLLETDAERALVASLLFEKPSIDDPAKVAVEGLVRLRSRALMPRVRFIEAELARAMNDSAIDAAALLRERSELQRRLRSPLALVAVA